MDIDALLESPYWVIDFLPYQVPAGCEGQFFKIEDYYLKPSRMECLQRKFLTVILKLNCYYLIKAAAGDQWIDNPDLVYIQDQINGRGLDILIGDTLIQYNRDDTHMTVYNPTEKLLELLRILAQSEGLFVWKPEGSR